MAKEVDTRLVVSGVWTEEGILIDPDDIEEKVSPEQVAYLVKQGALAGEWKGGTKAVKETPVDAQLLAQQTREIAELKAQLEAAKKASQPVPTLANPQGITPPLANAPQNPGQGRK